MLIWPAQLNPLLELDSMALLFGGLALVTVLLLLGVVLLARSIRRRNTASSVAELDSEETPLSALQAASGPEEVPAVDEGVSGVEIAEVMLPASGAEVDERIADRPAAEPVSSETPSEAQESAPALLYWRELEARTYLEQVNEYVLLQHGTIFEAPDKVELSWQTRSGSRSIHIAASVDERELMINGIPFEASPGGLKRGIVASLKSPDNQ